MKDNGLQASVKLLFNLERDEIEDLYKQADLFVIPSTAEPASISQLEAMAFSVPVICSDKNGTACYVRDGISGFLFQDNQKEALKATIKKMVSDKKQMMEMGKSSYEAIQNNCSFSQYYDGIMKCVDMQNDKSEGKN